MEHKEFLSKKSKYLFFVLIFCILACIYVPWGRSGIVTPVIIGPVVRNSEVDLRQWTMQDIIPLNGEWLVFCDQLDGRHLSTLSADLRGPHLVVTMPQLWNYGGTCRRSGESHPDGFGAATYRIVLHLPEHAPLITLRIPQILSASAIWINGRQVAVAGRPARLGRDEVARTPLEQVITIQPDQHTVTMAIEVSNHFHFEGGISSPVLIGTRDNLEKNREYRLIFDSGVFAALLILVFYIAAFGVTTHAPGWGWLLVLVIWLAIRLGCTSGLLAQLFPGLSASVLFRLEYLSIYVPWPIYFRLLSVMFPGHLHRFAGRLILLFATTGCLLALLTPVALFTQFRDTSVLILIGSATYYIWCIATAIRNQEAGADILGLGVVFFLACVLHDGLMYAHWLAGIDLGPMGGLVLLFFHIIVLGQRFVTTLEHVQVLSTSLATLNDSLEAQVVERTNLLEQTIMELHHAKEHAEKEAINKDRFLAHLSHEVRTPLNAIFGMTTLLLRDSPRREQRHRLELMRFSGAGLVRLLDDILEMSRLEAGRVKIARTPFDLARLIRHFADIMAERCAQAGLAFHHAFDPMPPSMVGDPDRLQQLLGNVIDNAIKFTPKGMIRFVVRAEAAAGGWDITFELTNTNPGIPPHVLGTLFQEFVRGPDTEVMPGSGLGLAIVKRLATSMGGKVCLENIEEGSRFTFTLRLDCADGSGADNAPPRLMPRSGLRILLVEDMPENRMVMLDMLAPFDMDIMIATSGHDALAHVEGGHFDAMLLDMVLPDMQGENVALHVMAHHDLHIASMPVIAVTANVIEADLERYRAAGIDHIVAKPVVLDELLAALATVCGTAPEHDGTARPPEGSMVDARLPLFIQACRESRDDLQHALASSDHDRMRRLAHRLRGSARTFGYGELGQIASMLEDGLSRSSAFPDLSLAPRLLAALDGVITRYETHEEPTGGHIT